MQLPKYAVPSLVGVALAFFLGNQVLPSYRHILVAIGFVGFGPLLIYLAITLRCDAVQIANTGQPTFLQIPKPGQYARILIFILGICVFILGVAMVLGKVQ